MPAKRLYLLSVDTLKHFVQKLIKKQRLHDVNEDGDRESLVKVSVNGHQSGGFFFLSSSCTAV